jgi:cellobiose-specific phosphotransferase system component IIB
MQARFYLPPIINKMLHQLEQNDPECQAIILQHTSLSSHQIDRVIAALANNSHVTYLNLLDNFLTKPQVINLIEALKTNTSLKSIAVELIRSEDDEFNRLITVLSETISSCENRAPGSSALCYNR